MKDLKIPVEVELFIWKKLANHVCESGNSGFSFSYYHSLEIEVFLTLGYFVEFEAEFTAPLEHKDYQVKVATKKMKPRKDQLVVFVGPQRRKRFFGRWGVRVSKARGETYTPPAELLDLHMLLLAQCFAFRL